MPSCVETSLAGNDGLANRPQRKTSLLWETSSTATADSVTVCASTSARVYPKTRTQRGDDKSHKTFKFYNDHGPGAGAHVYEMVCNSL